VVRAFLVVFDERGAFGAAGLLGCAVERREVNDELQVAWMAANADNGDSAT
jgi:hypothetical protein